MKFEKQQIVFIRPDSKYYGGDALSNPKEMRGKVLTSPSTSINYKVKWANGRVNYYNQQDLEIRRAEGFEVGDKVTLNPNSRFVGNINNPVGVTGTVSKVMLDHLAFQVKWEGNKPCQNSYSAEDLLFLGDFGLEPERKSTATIRVVMCGTPLRHDKKFATSAYFADLESLETIPSNVPVVKLTNDNDLQGVMSSKNKLVTTDNKMVGDFPYIYIMTGTGVFCQVAHPNIQRTPTFEPKEVGKLYRIVKGVHCRFVADSIVELVQQEDPRVFTGSLPYKVKLVNTGRFDWISGLSILEEV